MVCMMHGGCCEYKTVQVKPTPRPNTRDLNADLLDLIFGFTDSRVINVTLFTINVTDVTSFFISTSSLLLSAMVINL